MKQNHALFFHIDGWRHAVRLLGVVYVLALIFLCGCTGKDGDKPLTAEERRLQRSCRIDTTTLRTVLAPDSIEGWARLNDLTAEAWILVDDSSGLVLSERNAHQRMFPASLTKMMTCLLTLEKGNDADTIEITKDVFLAKDSRVKLGDSYLEGHLVREMMLQSDNDAAYALAKHLGGSIENFCDTMNQKAAYLHMDSTHFANPNGMPNDSNYSTAFDLLKLTRYCMQDSVFASIAGTKHLDIPLLDGRHMPIDNTNLLLKDYEGCFGVKTGYTRKAGGCLASAATRQGVTLYLILLKSRSQSTRFAESALLLDYGFRVMEAYRAKVRE
jgi:D-alanyl-D-alanine carboxypeptidase